jgi:hypothetical protein
VHEKGHLAMAFFVTEKIRLHALKNGCNTLTAANAHRDQCIAPVDALEFVQSFDSDQSACGADGVTQ